jgi:hypothetical protein
VKKVLANSTLYARALDRPPVTLTERLGTILPRSPAAAVAKVE